MGEQAVKSWTIGFGIGETRDGFAITDDQRRAILQAVKETAAGIFGGFTLFNVQGGWVNPEGRLVEEPGISLLICSPQPEHVLREFADYVRRVACQHSVVLTGPDGSVSFVEESAEHSNAAASRQ